MDYNIYRLKVKSCDKEVWWYMGPVWCCHDEIWLTFGRTRSTPSQIWDDDTSRRVGVDHQWRAMDGQTVFGQYLVNDDRTIHAFYVWVCLWTNSIVCPRAPPPVSCPVNSSNGHCSGTQFIIWNISAGSCFFPRVNWYWAFIFILTQIEHYSNSQFTIDLKLELVLRIEHWHKLITVHARNLL